MYHHEHNSVMRVRALEGIVTHTIRESGLHAACALLRGFACVVAGACMCGPACEHAFEILKLCLKAWVTLPRK